LLTAGLLQLALLCLWERTGKSFGIGVLTTNSCHLWLSLAPYIS